ncbi:hypothetical protein ABOONEI_2309 [Aciduliprofundum boonei T469]|nr:hypothetical protein ABOONEI_2309 [Aciduliprofundum boonei T469]
MGLFRKKKKLDEKKVKRLPFDIDWRVSPEEFYKIALFSSILFFFIAWTSIIASSILYLLAIGGVLITFLNYREEITGKFRYIAPFLTGIFFLLFSLSPRFQAYILGAYLSSFFVNVLGYWAIKDALIEKARGGEEW